MIMCDALSRTAVNNQQPTPSLFMVPWYNDGRQWVGRGVSLDASLFLEGAVPANESPPFL